MTFLLALLLVAATSPAQTADVLIQAGHQGRPASCALFPKRACNLGAPGERENTPKIADEAARRLRAAGLRVVRVPADYREHYRVRAAIFIHLDGADPPCTSGASIGYPRGSEAAAHAWRAAYSRVFPFRFMPDNFTEGLAHYYGYRTVAPNPNTLVLEMGELTCPPQHAWLATRYRRLGDVIANFVLSRLTNGRS